MLMILSSLLLLTYSIWCGLGLTNDAINYLKGGELIAQGGDFSDKNLRNMLYNGPVLPMLLSFSLTDAESYYRILSVLFLAVTLISFNYLIDNIIVNRYLKLWVLGVIAFGMPLFLVYNFLWTESAFMAILSLIFVYVYLYVKKGGAYIFVVGGLCFLLTLIRLGGIIFPVTIFTVLLFSNFKLLKQPKFLVGLALSVSGFVLWRLYAQISIGGQIRMPFALEGISLISYQTDYLSSLSLWFTPIFLNEYLRISVVVLVIVLLLILFLINKHKMALASLNYTRILVASIIVYYVVRSIFKRDPDEIDRYLSEIYPLGILFMGIVVDVAINQVTIKKRLIILTICFVWLIYPVTRTIKNAVFWHTNNCTVQLNK